jgi:tRNA pseudouridine55 synthase
MNGVIVLDKPAGISSAKAVDQVKRLLPRGTKVGHAGTLDPFATGVLLLLVGKATKLCERLMDSPKQYGATMKLGATTETDDPESPETPVPGAQVVAPNIIEREVRCFIGAIQQRPPQYSAIKLGGRRACDRIRAGEQVKIEPRTVPVYGIEIVEYAWPELKLKIDCGRGTYIRSIARDLGEKLGVGGYLTALRRTRVGEYSIEQAFRLDQLRTGDIETLLNSLIL